MCGIFGVTENNPKLVRGIIDKNKKICDLLGRGKGFEPSTLTLTRLPCTIEISLFLNKLYLILSHN